MASSDRTSIAPTCKYVRRKPPSYARSQSASPLRTRIGCWSTFTATTARFKQSAQSALALQTAVKFTGPVMALFVAVGKSRAGLAYVNDETNAGWALPHFIAVLAQLQRAYPTVAFSFLSHSLGGRLATRRACSTCGTRYVRRALDVRRFFAPDVDSDTMRDELAASGLCAAAPVAGSKGGPGHAVRLEPR